MTPSPEPEAVRCPAGHAMHFAPERLQWECRCGAEPITEQRAALDRLGPYATRKQPPFEPRPIPGYVQTGPTSYERIGPGPDFRDVWRDGLRAVASLIRKGKW